MTTTDLVWAALGAALVVGVVLLQRLARTLAPSWLVPTHAPIWGLAGACLAVATAVAASVHPDLAHAWAAPLGVAERGPTGRFAALAVALAALLALVLLGRLAFAALRPRRGAHAPVPAAFLLFGIGPDGTPLAAARARARALFATLALAATALSAWLPWAVDPSVWAAAVAALTGLWCAFQADARPTALPAAAPASATVRTSAPLWPFPAAIVRRAREAAALAASGPTASGKTHAALTLAAEHLGRGEAVLWIVPTEAARAAIQAAADALWQGAPAIDRARDLPVLTPSGLEQALRTRSLPRLGRVVVSHLDVAATAGWTGAELGRVRFLLHRADPTGAAPLLALGTLAGPALHQAAELLGARSADLLEAPAGQVGTLAALGAPEPDPTAVRILAPPPQDAALGRTVARTALRAALREGPQARARLERVFSPALVESELRVLREAGVLLETETSRVRTPAFHLDQPQLVLVRTVQILSASPTSDVSSEAGELGPVLRLREPRSGAIHEVPRALADLAAYEGAILALGGTRWEVQADDAPNVLAALAAASDTTSDRRLVPPTADLATPMRTLRVALDGPARRAIHRLRGPAEFELASAKIFLHARHTGVRHYTQPASQLSPTSAASGAAATSASRAPPRPPARPAPPASPEIIRVHSAQLATPRLTLPFPTEARLLLLPSADPTALHTLVHALRDVLPTRFQGASEDLGVTYALPGELGLGPSGALVLWDRHPEGLGAVADLRDEDVQALLEALRTKLAACDCQTSCARCVERPSCTLTPHNVGLDRRRALAVLDALLVPAQAGHPGQHGPPGALVSPLREPLRKTA